MKEQEEDLARIRTGEAAPGGEQHAETSTSGAPKPVDADAFVPLFRVWDNERKCWAGDDDGTPNVRDLRDYALDEFKDDKLVYCDMEGWSIADCGELYLHDECGNSACADTRRFEIMWNPKYLAALGHEAAERWRQRALKAEAALQTGTERATRADSAEILSSERRTSDGPRDNKSSSSSSADLSTLRASLITLREWADAERNVALKNGDRYSLGRHYAITARESHVAGAIGVADRMIERLDALIRDTP